MHTKNVAKQALACSLMFVSSFCGTATADDVVETKDGKKIEGKVLSEEEESISIKTASGLVIVAQNNVQKIQRDKSAKDVIVPAAEEQAERGIQSKQARDLIALAVSEAEAENLEESVKFYTRALAIESSVQLHRQMARKYFEIAERIYNRQRPDFQATLAELEAAEKNAWEVKRGLGEGNKNYKKFNPKNERYIAAVERHQESLKNYNKRLPFYDKAQSAYNSVLRLSKSYRDFEADGHIPLCLLAKNELNGVVRCRQLLKSFLDSYKPGNETERALYTRCQTEQERLAGERLIR